MKFNICYDAVSLIFLLVVTFRFFSQKYFPVFSNWLYGALLILGNLNIVFDILGTVVLIESLHTPIWILYAVNVTCYILILLIAASLVIYIIALIANRKYIEKWLYFCALIPVSVFMLVFFVSMPLGKIFTISESGAYIYGDLSFIPYACVAFHLLILFLIIITQKEFLSKLEIVSFCAMGLLVISATVLQYIFPKQLLSGSAIALSFLIMYFTIQDPRYSLDAETQVFTGNAMKQIFDSHYAAGHNFHLSIIYMHGLHNMYMLYGRKVGNAALNYIGDFLLSRKNTWNFRAGDSLFISSYKSEEDLDDFIKDFELFRKKSFNYENVDLHPDMTVFYLRNANQFDSTRQLMAVVENALDDSYITPFYNQLNEMKPEFINKFQRNVAIEDEMKASISTGANFEVYYQPIYSLKKKRFASLEALVRYNSDNLGVIRPDEFIPLIEKKGLALDLDQIVVEKIFKTIKAGSFKDFDLDCIHINLSAASFSSHWIVDRIIYLAKHYSIDPSFIVFEITETADILSEEVLKKCAIILREAGFGLALDDFGTGYSNIRRVCELPFTHVKLDKSLIQETPLIVESIIKLFKSLKMTIIAEGVETKEQMDVVSNCGSQEIQGYYYARPMNLTDLIEMLKTAKKKTKEVA